MNEAALRALCALFDCVARVHASAFAPEPDPGDWRFYLPSLQNGAESYPNHASLRSGRRLLRQFIHGQNFPPPIAHYAFQCMNLAKKVARSPAAHRKMLQERLQQLPTKLQYFGDDDAPIKAFLAGVYGDCISPLGQKIQVRGLSSNLQNEAVINHIRMLLLFAVRAASWWRFYGGSRWHLLRRQALWQALEALPLDED